MATQFSKPICTRFGFFSKKGIVIILILYPIIDSGFALFVANDKEGALWYFLPFWIIVWSAYLLIRISGNLIFKRIFELYGIDFRSSPANCESEAHLASFFKSKDQFIEYQKSADDRMTRFRIPIIAGLITSTLILVAYIFPFFFGFDIWIESIPELKYDINYFILRFIPLTIFSFWGIFSVLNLILLLLEVALSLNELIHSPGSLLKDIITEEEDNAFQKIIEFSIDRFRTLFKQVSSFILWINIFSLIGLIFAVLYIEMYIYLLDLKPELNIPYQFDATPFFRLSFVPYWIVASIILINLLILIFPHITFHNQLEEIKNYKINFVENKLKGKRIKWYQDQETKKDEIWTDIQILSDMLEESKAMSTMPFFILRYVSTSVIASAIVSIILFIVENVI